MPSFSFCMYFSGLESRLSQFKPEHMDAEDGISWQEGLPPDAKIHEMTLDELKNVTPPPSPRLRSRQGQSFAPSNEVSKPSIPRS